MMYSNHLTPNKARILEAILLLIQRAQKEGFDVTQYDLVKSLFIADTSHLKVYGRPITYDNYSAMEHGPVPRFAYDMLKPGFEGAKFFGEWPLWGSEKAYRTVRHYKNPVREPNLRRLSVSDVTCLEEAQDIVRTLGFGGTRDFTHKHPAYMAAWRKDDNKRSFPMDYKLLIEDQDEELMAEIVMASKRH